MKIRPNRSLVRAGVHALGEAAVRVPLAGRVVGQLLDPATPPWRRAILLFVLADAALSTFESVQPPVSLRRARPPS